MMAMSMSSTYSGRVAAVNPKGLRLDGHESWFNISRFATDVVLPERGETVTVVVDGKGFLRAIQPLDGPGATNGSHDPTPASAPGAIGTKDRTITRLAVLKAAAAFAASRPEASSADVLKVAEAWERWVLRPDAEPREDLADAF
jgi:hypothetical protein